MRHLWRTLETYGADVALVGHDHDYERFAPQTSEGVAKPSGIRQFVVGTGGNSHGGLVKRQPYSEAFDNKTFGLLRLDLAADSYRWKFLPVKGSSFTDAGTGRCHP